MAQQRKTQKESKAQDTKRTTHPALVGTPCLGPTDTASRRVFFTVRLVSPGCAPAGRFLGGRGSACWFPCDRPATSCSPDGPALAAFRSRLLGAALASVSAIACAAPRAPLRTSASSSVHSQKIWGQRLTGLSGPTGFGVLRALITSFVLLAVPVLLSV